VQAMTSVAKFIWPIPDKGLGRRLHRVKADTLVVAGAEDRFVPAVYADEFARAIRGARREIIPEAEHMVAYERTAEVAELVERHLNASCG
jgi:pimeloyl-ACP methyl ester carboxylesterase